MLIFHSPVGRYGIETMITRDHELHIRRRARNIWLGLILGAFVVLVFAVTIVKMMNGAPMEAFDHTVRPSLTSDEQ